MGLPPIVLEVDYGYGRGHGRLCRFRFPPETMIENYNNYDKHHEHDKPAQPAALVINQHSTDT
jgi:hypothetical protein